MSMTGAHYLPDEFPPIRTATPPVNAEELAKVVEEYRRTKPRTDFDCLLVTPRQMEFVLRAIPKEEVKHDMARVQLYRFFGFPIYVAQSPEAVRQCAFQLTDQGKRPATFADEPPDESVSVPTTKHT